ncbi:MAG: hypothetical protein V3U89_01855 [Methylophilaceae bacterium]
MKTIFYNPIKRSFSILLIILVPLINVTVSADTPIDLFESHAGNVNFVGAQKTRRTQANSGNACAVTGANNTNTTTIAGIPAGATIRAAHLYWAGSFSSASGSTRTTPDYNVTFEGSAISADLGRRYTADYDATEQYFNGVKDVTSIVQARGNPNGSYSFSGLSVNTAAPHCTYAVVVAGWALVIIYEHPSEDFRVVNLFEGFELIYGESVTLTPSNFTIPASPINGKHAYLTWDGDASNSNARNGFVEALTFNGVVLSDANNPVNNQFNSISTINGVDNNAYGVDLDIFTIDSYLSAGQTSSTSIYSSGGDQVHLSMEIISVTNTPVSDLAISKTHVGNLNVGQNATYTIAVNNNGPIAETGPIVVTDTLPTGLTFVTATGTGWSCSATAQLVTCNRTGSLANGASTAPITLTVAVSAPSLPSVTNTASVSGNNFDNVSGNNSNSDTASVTADPSITLKKTSKTISDPVNGNTNPKAIPGALSQYTLKATNTGLGAADNNSIVLSDAIPANTALYVNDISGAGTGPVRFVDGSPPSGLTYAFSSLSSTTDNLSFSNNGGTSYNYSPTADANGVDSSVTHLKMATQGAFLGDNGSGAPNFELKFRVKIQ